MMLLIALELLITTTLMAFCVWLGYRMGWRKAMAVRVEALAKNARKVANQTEAEARVLEGHVRPHVSQVRVVGTSRRDLNS